MPPNNDSSPLSTTTTNFSMETGDDENMEQLPLPSLEKTYELTAINICYSKAPSTPFLPLMSTYNDTTNTNSKSSTTPILHNVSLTARPSELLAIVGPSGAGKSTLLDILSTRTSPTSGLLLLNSRTFPHAPFRRLSHHLPQHDLPLHHPLLTILETFLFASRLLPSPLPLPALLRDLRLSHLSHLPLSGPLSGGERRRVSLGLSLLARPRVLLLDEPTSGLDSSSALHALLTLRRLARRLRTTVVLSIHQPGSLALDAIDSFLLLHRGRPLHHGTLPSLHPLLLSLRLAPVPLHLNPLEHAMEIADDLLKALPDPSTPLPRVKTNDPFDVDVGYGSSRGREIAQLALRFMRIVCRTRQLLLTNSLEALGVGVILGTIYLHVGFDGEGIEKRLGLFAFTLTFLLSSTTESLPIFVNERPIVIREASGGLYRLSSHLVANTLVFLPYLLFMAFLYSLSVYFLVGLCGTWGAFAYFVLVTWAVVLMANSFVLFLSSLAPNYIAGTSLVTVSLAAFFLFSGYFLAKDTMPKVWVFMHYLSLYRYALDAMVVNEYWCSRRKCFGWEAEGKGEGRTCALTGMDVLEKKGLTEGQRWTNVEVMMGYFVLYRLLYWAVLARRISLRKK